MTMPGNMRVGTESPTQGLQRIQSPNFKVGKVLSVRREDHSVDVMLLDSGAVVKVPVLTSWMGSNFGFSMMVAPSYDKDQPAKKTYPESEGSVVHSQANESQTGRDLYALIAQVEGSGLGTAKMYVLGFCPAQVSEMLFARHEIEDGGQASQSENEGEFDDLMLFRHPSDVQVTTDKKGKISIQHPNGSRITMGETTGEVNLKKKDYDKLYELRHNLHKSVSTYVRSVDADGVTRADLMISAGGEIRGTVYDSDGSKKADLVMSSGGFWEGAVYADGEEQTARVRMEEEGKAEVWAQKEVKAHNDPGCVVILKENGDTEVKAPSNVKITAGANVEIQAGSVVKINGGSLIQETAPLITLN